jgi:hypothetical protein
MLSLLHQNTEQLILEFESKYTNIEASKISDKSDYSDLSIIELQAFSLNTIKDNFIKNKGLNPELQGWAGWVKYDAKSLNDHLKTMQNLPGHVLHDDVALYMQSKTILMRYGVGE